MASIPYDVEQGNQRARPTLRKQISSALYSIASMATVAGLPYERREPEEREASNCAQFCTALWKPLKSSRLNLLLLVVPFAWASHWLADQWGHEVTFILCLVAIIPLQNIFDWCAENFELPTPLGKDGRDLFSITFKNCVEATLAAILLKNCHLRLLQSTITGVVILHLLLVPGVAFFVQGSKTAEQLLHPHQASPNASLLMTGLLAIVLPTAFFAALDRGYDTDPAPASAHAPFSPLVSDRVRDDLLKMSRGMSVMLLLIYIASRLHRHLPPWLRSRPQQCTPTTAKSETAPATVDWLRMAPLADERDQHPPAAGRDGPQKGEGSRTLHQVACMLLIVVSIAVMAVTAEFLVESIDPFRERTGIEAEWFGLILLPLVSFAPEAVVAIVRFVQPAAIQFARLCRSAIRSQPVGEEGKEGGDTSGTADKVQDSGTASEGGDASAKVGEGANDDLSLAHGRPIDLSIQFTLWWMPLLVLFGWWTGKPVHLLFDYFEVALLLGSCFLVNYVTSDGKTNFVEGFTLILFYGMVALAAWFYPGQPQVALMLNCPGSVAEVVAQSGVSTNDLIGAM